MPRANRTQQASPPGLGVILLTVFLDLVGFSIIFPLFPEMLDHYLGASGGGGLLGQVLAQLRAAAGASGAQADFLTQVLFGGLLGSIYSLLQFVAAPVWGAISDRIGRRGVLLWTISGTALSYALWIVAGSFALLVLSRVIGGIMSGNISVATAAIADVTDERDRTKAMGLLGAAFGVGFIVGPAIGGGLSLLDLREPLAFIPGINPFSAPAVGALLLTLWNLIWVITRFGETRPGERSSPGGPRRPVNPVVLLRPTRIAGVDRSNLIYFLFIAAFAGVEFTLTFLARDRFAYDARDNVLLFLFTGFIIAAVQGGVVRKLVPRLGEVRLVQAGFTSLSIGLVTMAFAGSEAVMYLGLGLLAVGVALASPSLTGLVSLYAPEDRQGEILGVFRSLGSFARAVAPIGASLLYWRYGSLYPYLGCAAFLSLPLLLTLGLPRRDA